MKIKLIVFDFDGVIIDSLHERYLVAMEMWKRLGGKLEDTPETRKIYRKACSFIVSAEDQLPVLKEMENGNNFNEVTQEDFEQMKKKWTDGVSEFVKTFYAVREELKKNFDKYLKLHTLFPQAEELRRIAEKHRTVIGTGKDRHSALILLKAFGFDYNEEEITGREYGITKTEQMRKLMEKFGIKAEEILFVEDMFESVVKTREMGVKSVLVDWGYANDIQKEEARKIGIPIIEKKNVEKQIEALL